MLARLKAVVALATLAMPTITGAEPIVPVGEDPLSDATFTLTPPPAATIKRQEGPDFFVYRITWGEGGALSLYEGCCPQTVLRDATKQGVSINGLAGELAVAQACDTISKEWHIKNPQGQYQLIVHAWYSNLSPADAAVADAAVATIKPKPR